jgi:hypothetical protein
MELAKCEYKLDIFPLNNNSWSLGLTNMNRNGNYLMGDLLLKL